MILALTACLGILAGVCIERHARHHALIVKAQRYVASSPVWILGDGAPILDPQGNVIGTFGPAFPAGLALNDQEAIERLLEVAR